MHRRWCGYVLVVWCLLHDKVIKVTTESGCGWCHCAPPLQHFYKLDYRCQTWMCPVAPWWPQGFNQPWGRPSSRQQWQTGLCQLLTFCLKLYHYCSATTFVPHCEFDTRRFQQKFLFLLNDMIVKTAKNWYVRTTGLDPLKACAVLLRREAVQYTSSTSTRHQKKICSLCSSNWLWTC